VEFLAPKSTNTRCYSLRRTFRKRSRALPRERSKLCRLSGRLWLRTEGLLVERDAKQPNFRQADPVSRSVLGQKFPAVRALLSHRDREWSHKELVERTGLSKGLVSRLVRPSGGRRSPGAGGPGITGQADGRVARRVGGARQWRNGQPCAIFGCWIRMSKRCAPVT